MRRAAIIFFTCSLMAITNLSGCGPAKAGSSSAAIEESKDMETTQAKADYLIAQAKAFYNSDDFQGAVDIAQYILRNLDKDSQAAQNLLEKAKEALKAQAKSAMDEASGGLGF